MLKNIPPLIGPELLKTIAEMGHGDEIVIADGNFPSASMNRRVIHLDGHGGCSVLEALLKLFPLDHMQDNAFVMAVNAGDNVETPIWDQYDRICRQEDPNYRGLRSLERQEFYDRAQKAYAVIATSEKALYANILIRKGVI